MLLARLKSRFIPTPPSPWLSTAPVREELFGAERLEQHAISLAHAQTVTKRPPRVSSLRGRLDDNAAALLIVYRSEARALAQGGTVMPASEWLLDNYHLVEEQIREIREDLPPGYYKQLPKLASGPFAGYPRVFGIAWAFIAHTDSHIEPLALQRFLHAYQSVQRLTIGELWAVAITLRIVLIENLRRLADQITMGMHARAQADALADASAPGAPQPPHQGAELSEIFAAQLAKRLRGQDPRQTPLLQWLTDQLAAQASSIDDVVQHAQQRLGASNLSVRNIVTSMRLMSAVDWTEMFEQVSTVDARLRENSDFGDLDFPTRNLYRTAVEYLSRRSPLTEIEIVDYALDASRAAHEAAPTLEVSATPHVGALDIPSQRARDPGHHLIGAGRHALEAAIGFRPPLRLSLARLTSKAGIGAYIAAVAATWALLMGAVLALLSPDLGVLALCGVGVLTLLPAWSAATACVDRLATWQTAPALLPALALRGGIPASMRTLLVVPTLLHSAESIAADVERLEVHHLSGRGGDISFALLSDFVDAPQATMAGDAALLACAADAISLLNTQHGPAPGPRPRFVLMHRARRLNRADDVWMGWERKRGKLHELNRLLRGATDTSFVSSNGQPLPVPADVRYVITLDADTRLPRDTAIRLVGKMAHPMNRAMLSHADESAPGAARHVVSGYGILQPRVTPALPMARQGSLYQRVFSAPGGMDPYAAAVSDVYQDLFGEGAYTGKGIYDVDAFEAALVGRVPENTMLSHDLFEGLFARVGLVSDIEVVDDMPARYDVAASRQHRWIRGDWQLLPWIFSDKLRGLPTAAMARWKLLENLRRSLHAPALMLALLGCAALPWPGALQATALVILLAVLPAWLHVLSALRPPRAGVTNQSHLRKLAQDIGMATWQLVLSLALAPDQAWRAGDAIVRTLARLRHGQRGMLEWTSSAAAARAARPDVAGTYAAMKGGMLAVIAVAAIALLAGWPSWPLAAGWAALALAGPWIAWRISAIPPPEAPARLSADDVRELRLTARRTWRFFETFVTPADHMLPPDNFQEDPKPVLARRTSPTNIGLYFLTTVSARDFGWIGLRDTCERLTRTLDTLDTLPRHRGHFFNWYDTGSLAPLAPKYVSSVDSGNLAGHLLALAGAAQLWRVTPRDESGRAGLTDTLHLLREACGGLDNQGATAAALHASLDDFEALLVDTQLLDVSLPALKRLAQKIAVGAAQLSPTGADAPTSAVQLWGDALQNTVNSLMKDVSDADEAAVDVDLLSIATRARALAMAMDFSFLLDPERKLLSIGYSVQDDGLDENCYDLLASEARLASLFAIAKGDIPTSHWARLGRTATPLGKGSALISWSGSMFEYLMPSLVMRAAQGSLLEQTNRLIVAEQIDYGRRRAIPWGISESAFNARDIEFTYQYSNFGVPGLGLKRGLGNNTVIAPYACGLAAMVDPESAQRNFEHIRQLGGLGEYGFYEALDFTPARLPEGDDLAVVRTYMAHHQGMTVVALCNVLLDGRMRARMHHDPIIQACELLLQERMPRDVAVAPPRAREVSVTAPTQSNATYVRTYAAAPEGAPVTHLLSNGHYSVMLTASGAGYSRWGELAITRWRDDTTVDPWGSFIYLRDVQSAQSWRAGAPSDAKSRRPPGILFGEDHAEFIGEHDSIASNLTVLVSGEDDAEVRRVSLTNNGRHARDIDLTSYMELVLARADADRAHPAFSKLFVVTEFLHEYGALLATRRTRTPTEASIHVAHFAVIEGDVIRTPEFETDRQRMVQRGMTIDRSAAIVQGTPLTQSIGTVLDPVFALRHRVRVAAGKTVRVAFWTVAAASREQLLGMIDKHCDRSAFARARTLAWTQAEAQLRHLDVNAEETADFQRLAASLLYADPGTRAPSALIEQGAAQRSVLWSASISGDLPIVLLRIDDLQDIGLLHQLLRAHEYWRTKGLAVDLVIVNERTASYVQDLQSAIDLAVRSNESRPLLPRATSSGSVHTLRADLVGEPVRHLLQSIARVALIARRGDIAAQLTLSRAALMQAPAADSPVNRLTTAPATVALHPSPTASAWPPDTEALDFFNGTGGFDRARNEYVIVLADGATTPLPWINVIANAQLGFHVSAEGAGYTWAGNSRENTLTPWSNDPVSDPNCEAFYLTDAETDAIWSPTASPARTDGIYVTRHGRGYTSFTHRAHDIESELLQLVPLADPIKLSRLRLHNMSTRVRRLHVTAYAEWVLGTQREASAPLLITSHHEPTDALLVRNPWNLAFPSRTGFSCLAPGAHSWTCDRSEFLGRRTSASAPQSLVRGQSLGRRAGAGMDPCTAHQILVEIPPGATIELTWLLGEAADDDAAIALIERYRTIDMQAVLDAVQSHWHDQLEAVQVRTPDPAMDIMLNGHLLYQTIACRITARSAFYQASGAYGFRDQLQDHMALAFTQPHATRAHLLVAASRQFVEGDVQHWWLPHSGQGVRTRISDDRVWLAYATASYIECSGDTGVLDASVPFLEGPPLEPGQHDAFFTPGRSALEASLLEHCARGLDQCLALTGERGMPLIGTGDWNDGMNRVGEHGRGESVWLGWLLIRTIDLLAPHAERRDPARAARWRTHAASVLAAIETHAWDGQWYRRATYDDGTWLGARGNDACEIDMIAQSWAVLSGQGDPARAEQAMQAVQTNLVRTRDKLALLFTPPFDSRHQDPGYIAAYPPGLRENGGQYSHAAMWCVLAYAELGQGDQAGALFSLLNPINHAQDALSTARYKVEPYAVAADIYSEAPHVGRGGWTWYTGSAAWMYRAG
ncbi:MAG: glucoamylase family protein, partial [Burkholderiaceae bacterium]